MSSRFKKICFEIELTPIAAGQALNKRTLTRGGFEDPAAGLEVVYNVPSQFRRSINPVIPILRVQRATRRPLRGSDRPLRCIELLHSVAHLASEYMIGNGNPESVLGTTSNVQLKSRQWKVGRGIAYSPTQVPHRLSLGLCHGCPDVVECNRPSFPPGTPSASHSARQRCPSRTRHAFWSGTVQYIEGSERQLAAQGHQSLGI